MKRGFSFVLMILVSVSIFAATMDSRVRKVDSKLTEKLFTNPTYEDISALSKALSKGVSDTKAKVKVFHDWICDNIAYDTDLFTVGVGDQDPISVLKKKAAICIGYSNMLLSLCYFADIEALVIQGWSKGFRYPGFLRERTDHSWNAIKIGSKWYLVDCTWDAGYVDYRTYVKHYSTDYFFMPAEQFIYSHLPEEEDKQFLPKKQIRSHEDFEREPYLTAQFFAYGLSLGKREPSYKTKLTQSAQFDFGISKNGVLLNSQMTDSRGKAQKQSTWIDLNGNKFTLEIDVPGEEEYKVKLFAKNKNSFKILDYISIPEFEELLSKAKNLVQTKKINQKEYDFFEKSYFKVEENGFYYYREDLFDNARIAAVTKVLKLTEAQTDVYEETMTFLATPDDDYTGYGAKARFPVAYSALKETGNVRLVFPREGTLKKGETIKFQIESKSFSMLGFIVNDNLIELKKNAKTGLFEIEYTIPDEITTLDVYGSKDKKHYSGLFSYTIE